MLVRSLALVVLLAGLGLGGWLATQQGAGSEEVRARLGEYEQAKQAAEQARAAELAANPALEASAAYRTEVEAGLRELELPESAEAVDALLVRLREPNTYFHPISQSAPRKLAIGASLREGDLELSALGEELKVQRRGIESSSKHTLLRVHNVGQVPLAYRIQVRASDGSDCRLRALTHYDPVILQPDEQARISVCSGTHQVEVMDLRFMELTPIGAAWLAKLPVRALGLDDMAVRSHVPEPNVVLCEDVPVFELGGRIAREELAWEDVVDFYSRHDCAKHGWIATHRRIVDPLAELPVRGR